jgi:hypothetical protein
VVGIDYSRTSGAEAMLIFVDGAYGAGPRELAWEAAVGDVPPERVGVSGNTFTVRPAGTDATLRGVVLHPPTAMLNYRPPHAGRAGRVQVWMHRPKLTHEQVFERSVERLADLDTPLPAAHADLPGGGLAGPTVTDRARLARRREEARRIYRKLLDATSSIKQGAGDRRPRARSCFVVVLTIHAGAHPPVRVCDGDTEALVAVGDQKITYRENYVLFERSR